MSEATASPTVPNTESVTPEQSAGTRQVTERTKKSRRRWIKVDVPEDVFIHVHDMANKSRMRLLPYLRRFLREARSFESPGDQPGSMAFGSDRTATQFRVTRNGTGLESGSVNSVNGTLNP